MVRRHLSTIIAVGLTGGAVAGCEDYEQRAQRVGRDARTSVTTHCKGAAAAVFADCVRAACASPCTTAALPEGFVATCVDACAQAGLCATDEDCRAPERCVAIAPRVRRCGPAPAPSAR